MTQMTQQCIQQYTDLTAARTRDQFLNQKTTATQRRITTLKYNKTLWRGTFCRMSAFTVTTLRTVLCTSVINL